MFEPQRASGGWESVMEQYGNMVYRLALARTHRKEDAEDVFQDVFLNLIKRDKSYESEEHFKASLIRSTINASSTLLRVLSRRRTAPETQNEAVEDEDPFRHSELYRALARLGATDRTVIHLCYEEDMTAEEIGRILGIKPSSVRSRLTRIRSRLARYLREEEEGIGYDKG